MLRKCGSEGDFGSGKELPGLLWGFLVKESKGRVRGIGASGADVTGCARREERVIESQGT